jgi:hypothetical protein
VDFSPRLVVEGVESARLAVISKLQKLCRHSSPLLSLDPNDFENLPFHLEPTLFLNLGSALERKLVRSSLRSSFRFKKGRLSSQFAAMVLSTEEPIKSPILSRQCFHVLVSPPMHPVISDQDDLEELQNMLFGYRVRHLNAVSSSWQNVSPPTHLAHVASWLSHCVVGDSALRETVFRAWDADQDLHSSAPTLHDAVLAALFERCHESSERIGITEIASTANAFLMGQSSRLEISPEACGRLVKQFGLSTRRYSRGNSVELSLGNRERVHELARHRKIEAVRNHLERCAMCCSTEKSSNDVCM